MERNVLREKLRCPNCRSLLLLKGIPDPNALNLQELYCPVCGQKILVSAARKVPFIKVGPSFIFGIPPILLIAPLKRVVTFTWQIEKVLEKGPEPIPPPYISPQKITPEPFWETVKKGAKEERKQIFKKVAIYTIGGIVVVKVIDKIIERILK